MEKLDTSKYKISLTNLVNTNYINDYINQSLDGITRNTRYRVYKEIRREEP